MMYKILFFIAIIIIIIISSILYNCKNTNYNVIEHTPQIIPGYITDIQQPYTEIESIISNYE